MTFLVAIFCLFSTLGIARDIASLGQFPAAVLASVIVLSGSFAVAWALVIMKSTKWLVPALALVGALLVVGRAIDLSEPTSALDAASVAAIRGRLRLDTGLLIGAVMAGYAFFIAFLADEGRRYLETHTEMALAKEIHRLLVPPIEVRLGPFEFYGASLPSGDVGGDLVDLVESDGAWVAMLADVSGHGVASGTLMGMFKSAVRSHLVVSSGLDRLLSDVNRVIFDLKKSNMFVTCALLRGTSGGQLEFTVAGHLPILHHRRAAGVVDRVSLTQLAVGMFRDTSFTAAGVSAEPGDILALVSDGFTEVFNERDEELGLGPIETLLARHAGDGLEAVFQAILTEARRHGRQIDDQSLLLVRYEVA
jgi:serine phosphatase RsbU (regulator of sigma subunit)